MIVCIEAVDDCTRNHIVQLYAYSREEVKGERRDDSVQSANHAQQIVDALCYKAEARKQERESASAEAQDHASAEAPSPTSPAPTAPAAEQPAVILPGEPPRDGYHPRLWIIQISVRNTHRRISRYHADYHKFHGCPNEVAEYMMEIFATVKHTLRRARADLQERLQERKALKAQLINQGETK